MCGKGGGGPIDYRIMASQTSELRQQTSDIRIRTMGLDHAPACLAARWRIYIYMYIYFIWGVVVCSVCILKRSGLGVTSRPDRDGRGFARPNQQMPKLRHANTMPTPCQNYANTCEKDAQYRGEPPCIVHSRSMCWHRFGMVLA